jgi:hypothetical protein
MTTKAIREITTTLLAAACLLPTQAWSQVGFDASYSANYAALQMPMSNFINSSFLNQQAMINATRPDARRKSPPSLILAPPQTERNAAELAMAAPAAQREKLQGIYVRLMPSYQQIEHKLGWPKDDVAGAVAALIAGNYMVMTDTTLSDPIVAAAGDQLRNSASMQDTLAKLSALDRRRLYEQSAMLGTFMALAHMSRQQQSQEVLGNLRNSARQTLELLLGDRVDKLRFTPSGIQLE